jgi:DNA-directed RNA polymerase sigma subunit (sigma70/sigma32)
LKQFIEKKIFNMGKLKEKLLNNLTPEEMDERFELSAFEYVEYMEKYKNKWQQLSLFDDNGDEIPEDVLEQIANERKETETEFYEQSEIDDINDSVKLKYTDNDILYVLDGLVDPQKMDIIKDKLRDVWNTKNGIL